LVYPRWFLAGILRKMGRNDEALSHYRRAVEVGESLIKSDPGNVMIRGYVSKAYLEMGDLETTLRRRSIACSYYEQSSRHYAELDRRGPGQSERDRGYARDAAQKAQACRQ